MATLYKFINPFDFIMDNPLELFIQLIGEHLLAETKKKQQRF